MADMSDWSKKLFDSPSFVPQFNHEGLIPPIMDNEATGKYRSPYKVSIADLIITFATSDKRCRILRGFLRLRHTLFKYGFSGFQWIGGSFVQQMDRDPNDIDVVSLVRYNLSHENLEYIIFSKNLTFFTGSKVKYLYDSYMVDLSYTNKLSSMIDQICYWESLFSHTRERLWKGILQIDLPVSYKELDFYLALIDWRQHNEFIK